MSCNNRHVLVTGASSGMGRAIALRLAEAEWHVFASVRRTVDGESLQQASDGRITPVLMDVTNPGQIEQAALTLGQHVQRRGLNALVNNAGVGVAWPLELIPLETFRRQFAINVDGQLAVTQAFLPMIRQATGRVIMIGSIADRITPPFVGPLAATKHALLAVTESLRQELAPWNIRVSLIEPGNIRSDAGAKFAREAQEALRAFTPGQRALYGDAFRAMTSRFAARHEHGSDPAVVAQVVLRALEARGPHARYLVGKDAVRFALLSNLPAFLLDALRRKIFGLTRLPAR